RYRRLFPYEYPGAGPDRDVLRAQWVEPVRLHGRDLLRHDAGQDVRSPTETRPIRPVSGEHMTINNVGRCLPALLLVLLASGLAGGGGVAQSFPSRNIRIVIPGDSARCRKSNIGG